MNAYPRVPNQESDIHGDQWVARLREEHAMHAYASQHARSATYHTPDNDGWVTLLVERWAIASAGGRALTKRLASFAGPTVSKAIMEADPSKAWHYYIDPAGAYPFDDPRRGQEAREQWAGIAQHDASPDGYDAPAYAKIRLTVGEAEAMLGWPIYRAAIAGEVWAALWGQASEREEKVLTTLAHCAGLPTPVVR